jgi:hypothetical protein
VLFLLAITRAAYLSFTGDPDSPLTRRVPAVSVGRDRRHEDVDGWAAVDPSWRARRSWGWNAKEGEAIGMKANKSQDKAKALKPAWPKRLFDNNI